MWQLFVMFTSPFISAQDKDKTTYSELEYYENFNQTEEGTTITDGQTNVFVEEVLEEEVHPAETLQLTYPQEFIFHFAFHKLSDYHATIDSHYLPPEVKFSV
jgi:hypothetical protein